MKNGIILVLFLIGVSTFAQRKVEKQETVTKNETIYLNFKFANDIKVEQWDKNQVNVKASVNLDNGKGNEYFNLKTERSSGEVKVYSDFGNYFKNKNRDYCNNSNTTEINYLIYVPKGVSLRVKSISGSLDMNYFSGNLSTELIAGDITLKKYDGEMHLETVSGDVDVAIDQALVDASTITGTIYSNLNIEQNTKKSQGINRINGSINNGTESIKLTTVSGNIYMRKK